MRIGRNGDLRLKAKDASLHGNLTVLGWIRCGPAGTGQHQSASRGRKVAGQRSRLR